MYISISQIFLRVVYNKCTYSLIKTNIRYSDLLYESCYCCHVHIVFFSESINQRYGTICCYTESGNEYIHDGDQEYSNHCEVVDFVGNTDFFSAFHTIPSIDEQTNTNSYLQTEQNLVCNSEMNVL